MKWKVIPGYDGLYRVSDTGIVQSCHKRGSRTGERSDWWDMKLQSHDHGYVVVGFGRGDARRNKYVHRLVAEAFIENPNGLPAINHLDGDRTNNCATNLEWCTNAENSRHAVRSGLIRRGSKHQLCKLTPEQVRSIRNASGTYRQIAQVFGVSAQTVCNVKRGVTYADVA